MKAHKTEYALVGLGGPFIHRAYDFDQLYWVYMGSAYVVDWDWFNSNIIRARSFRQVRGVDIYPYTK